MNIEELVEKVNNSEISSIRQVVVRIVEVINDPDSSAKDLKDIIEIDPPLSAKLLKLSNSAIYGYPKRIMEIQEAIVCIGFEAVKELALSQKVCEVFMKTEALFDYTRLELWKHCVAVAMFSKLIARREFLERGENMYVAGLLHDIGIIIIDQFLQKEFISILERESEEKRNLNLIEKEVIGYDHTDISKAVFESWDVPDQIIMAISRHHDPLSIDDEHTKNAAIIFLADYFCCKNYIGYGDSTYTYVKTVYDCLEKFGIKEKAMEIILSEVEEEIRKMEQGGFFNG